MKKIPLWALILIPGGLILTLSVLGYKVWRKMTETQRFNTLKSVADKWADFYGIPRSYMYATIHVESRWLPTQVNSSDPGGGAHGLGQILVTTAQGLGFEGQPQDLLDPDTNLKFVGKLMAQNIKSSDGNLLDAAARYNSGKPLDSAPDSTVNSYVPQIQSRIAYYDGLTGDSTDLGIG